MCLFSQWGARVRATGNPRRRVPGHQRGCTGFAGAERSPSSRRIPTHLHWHPGASLHHGLLPANCQVCIAAGVSCKKQGAPKSTLRNSAEQSLQLSLFIQALGDAHEFISPPAYQGFEVATCWSRSNVSCEAGVVLFALSLLYFQKSLSEFSAVYTTELTGRGWFLKSSNRTIVHFIHSL